MRGQFVKRNTATVGLLARDVPLRALQNSGTCTWSKTECGAGRAAPLVTEEDEEAAKVCDEAVEEEQEAAVEAEKTNGKAGQDVATSNA